jgi:hypothetical protein
LTTLLPQLDFSQSAFVLSGLPPALAKAAIEQSSGDSSYLLILMQVAEKLATLDDPAAVATFGEALTTQFKLPNTPSQQAVLARAAVPLLAQFSDSDTLVSSVTNILLVPTNTGAGAATREVHDRSSKALQDLRQALFSAGDQRKERPSQDLLQALRREWAAESLGTARANPYRRAAQMRLVAILAVSASGSTEHVTEDLLKMLPHVGDYLTREAIARALAAIAPKLPEAQREAALKATKNALAITGSTEEATAWAHAIAGLLPGDAYAATADIVEALKYPTATEAPSNVLLEALADRWEQESNMKQMPGKTLPNPALVDWLERHLPEGYSVTQPPPRPPGLQSTAAAPGSG